MLRAAAAVRGHPNPSTHDEIKWFSATTCRASFSVTPVPARPMSTPPNFCVPTHRNPQMYTPIDKRNSFIGMAVQFGQVLQEDASIQVCL